MGLIEKYLRSSLATSNLNSVERRRSPYGMQNPNWSSRIQDSESETESEQAIEELPLEPKGKPKTRSV
jgi:hypothetical protein